MKILNNTKKRKFYLFYLFTYLYIHLFNDRYLFINLLFIHSFIQKRKRKKKKEKDIVYF